MEGLGMAKDHCVLSHASAGKVFVEPRNSEAQTYVNGVILMKVGLVLILIHHVLRSCIPVYKSVFRTFSTSGSDT